MFDKTGFYQIHSLRFTLQLFLLTQIATSLYQQSQPLVETVTHQPEYFIKKLLEIYRLFSQNSPKYFRLGPKASSFKYYRTRLC